MSNGKIAAIIGGILAGLLILVIGAVATAMVVSDDPTPAPVQTVVPSETNDPLLDLLEETWNEQSYSDQKSLCWLFNTDPDGAYDAFNSGADGLIPEDTFVEFFTAKCATIT